MHYSIQIYYTGKLHARGPVGARELTTYKWIAEGRGQIRN